MFYLISSHSVERKAFLVLVVPSVDIESPTSDLLEEDKTIIRLLEALDGMA